MPRRRFYYEKFASYDEMTKKSTCLIETCRKELSGKLKGNIKRHYKLVHKQDIESDVEASDGEDTVVPKTKKKQKTIQLCNSSMDKDNCVKCCVVSAVLTDDDKEEEPESKKKKYNSVNLTNDKPVKEPTVINAALKEASVASIIPPIEKPKTMETTQQQQPERQPSTTQTDSCQQIAQIWGLKLAKMSRMQRIIAEKVINEVMFNGELGLLNVNTGLTNIGTAIRATHTVHITSDDEAKQEFIDMESTDIFGL